MLKKTTAFVLSIIMLTTIVVPAMAVGVPATAPESPLEIGPHPGIGRASSVQLQSTNYDAVVSGMIQDRIETYVPTAADKERAQEIVDLYNSVTLNSSQSLPNARDSFDDNWWKLRYGNLIEVTLDYDEGVTNAQVLRTIAQSRTAESDAADNFPQYQDSGQHFIWNFMMADTYTKNKARTIANNHEWGIAMITPMLNHFEAAYDEYIEDGYTENEASSNALADTVLYIPVFKYDSVCVIEASYAFFDYFFSDESIMDFWNNCYGRAYPEKGYTSGVSAFRYAAFTADELVLDGTTSMAENLTDDQKESVWEWDWYSY